MNMFTERIYNLISLTSLGTSHINNLFPRVFFINENVRKRTKLNDYVFFLKSFWQYCLLSFPLLYFTEGATGSNDRDIRHGAGVAFDIDGVDVGDGYEVI